MDKVEPQFIITVTGPKNTGKTTWLRSFIASKLLNMFPRLIVLSPTLDLNDDFDFLKHQDETEYFFEADPDKFEEVLREAIEMQFAEVQSDDPKSLLVILDDCATEDICRDRSILDKFAIRHRHYRMSFIIVGHKFQGTCGLPRSLRSQINMNIIFNPASMSELEILLKEAVLSDHIKEARKNAMEVFSEKYNFIVFTPANNYFQRLLVNWETPLINECTNPLPEKRKRKRKSIKKK